MAFENEDIEVEGIGNGQEALNRIAEFNPDIVLADVDMPGLNGFELSEKIKEAPETSGIKVLLLTSDFEDFDEQRYQTCGADNHISKPFKSDDIMSMVKNLLEGSSGDEDKSSVEVIDSEIVKQSVEEMEEAAEILSSLKVSGSQEEPSLEELLASVEKLSKNAMENPDLVGEGEPLEDEAPALMDEELQGPAPQSGNDNDIMDQMIQGVEELKESVRPSWRAAEEAEASPVAEPGADEREDLGYTDGPEVFAEVSKRSMDNVDELDSAFKELAMGGRPGLANHQEKPPELSSLGDIVPEPEDLLGHIAPGAFSEVGRRPATPEDIKENLDSISGFSDQARGLGPRNFPLRNLEYEAGDDRFTQAIAEEVKQVFKRSLGTSLEKEVSGLSDGILRAIREVVREVTPEIARRVIREEIEKIKKQDMY